MKKIQNKWLRILGIVLSMIGIALLARPLISTLFGEKLVFSFFGLFNGYGAIILSSVFLMIGLVIVTFTEPLDEENERHKQ